ncbi:MAG: hypothetical protein JW940_01710 [Polyangiaceae bacterium]|nr:hypothetical protein [Polyangiaceae bacterium]
MPNAIRWTFFRAGGFDQVKLGSGGDLNNLDQLDQKLWVALACPTSGLEVDSRTLALIDSDQDGRVRAPELIAAAKFACANLKNPDDLLKGRTSLPLRSINDKTEEGKALLGSAERVLANLGKKGDVTICADDLTDPTRIFADCPFNGDGVITELSSDDEFVRCVIRDIVDCIGSDPDRSGQPGVNRERVDAFFEELEAYSAWLTAGSADPGTWPLGREDTTAAAAAADAIRTKVDDYFARCRLAAFDPRLSPLLNRKEEEYLELATRDLSLSAAEVAGFPLAQVGPGRSLPLLSGVNPAHAAALKTLRDAAVSPLLGARELLSENEWLTITERLKPFETWVSGRQELRVEKLGEPRISELVSSNARETLSELIAKDTALEAEAASIEDVERLVRYNRDLYRICTNFVNFERFYDGEEPAIFQCGTLYLDQRACRLCLRVTDPAKHASVAGLAGAYLVYADCTRPATGEKMQIVAAVTNGNSDNLMVGRNGLFYDRQGRDWDATVTRIIDKPISVRQAFWSPYKKFARMIEERVAKRAAAADSESTASLDAAATSAVNTDRTPDKPADRRKIDVGSVAALGVAVGALGAFLTALVGYATGVLKLGVLATIGAILGIMLLISLPSVVLAYITLRKRNLGPILDACGWAVNANARISVPFGAILTSLAKLPPGSRRGSRDRYTDKGLPWKRYALLALVLLLGYRWYEGALDRFLPQNVHASEVLGRFAPEKPAPAPAATTTPAPQN